MFIAPTALCNYKVIQFFIALFRNKKDRDRGSKLLLVIFVNWTEYPDRRSKKKDKIFFLDKIHTTSVCTLSI